MYRILYVDDESSLLEICTLFLEKTGDFAVTTVLSATDATRLLEQEQFDAIVSDYQMPGMDGIQFLIEVRKRFGQIPFILFTGKGREEVVIQALNEGADFYIQKGGDVKAQFAELSHKIKKAVGGRQAEDALRENERRMREIIDNAPFGAHLYELKSDGKLVFTGANRAADSILNVKNQQFIGKTIEEAFPPLSQTEIPDAYRRVAATGELYNRDQVDYTDDGGIIGAFEVHAHPTGPNRMAVFFRDITERKQAEKDLSDSKRQLDAMAANIPGVIYRVSVRPDGTLRFDYISGRSRQILGIENDPATFFDCITEGIVPENRERFFRSVQEVISARTTWQFESQYVKPGAKEPIWLSVVSNPVIENDLLIFDGVIFDITDRKCAEQAQHDAVLNWQSTFDSTLDAICLLDTDQRIIRCNRAMQEILGVANGNDLIGHHCWEVVHGTERQIYGCPHLRMQKSLQREKMELKIGDRYFIVTTDPILDGTKTLVGAVHSMRDITDQKQAENVLKESEERFRKIFDTSPVGMALVTPEFRFIAVNPSFVSMTGYAEDDLLIMTFKDITHPDHLAGDMEHMRELAAGTIPVYSTEKRYIRKDGSILWGFIRVTTIYDSAGSLHSFIAQIDDITERKRAGESLKHLDERFRAIFNATFQFTGLMKPDGTLIEANQSALDYCGIKPDQVINKPFWETYWWQGDGKRVNDLRKAIARAAGGEFVRYEVELQGTGDTRGLFDFSIKPVFDAQGNVVLLVPEGRDITGRKRAEDALRQANKKLNLLSGITRHDIKNQILSLNGFLEISKKYSGDAAKMAEFITKEVQIANTIERQIAFAKEYENLGVAAPVWQDCRTLVEIAAKHAPLGNMPVKNDLPAGVEVFADPLIVKVFYSLLDNAMRHGGKITTIRFSAEVRDGIYIAIYEDDGVGVPAEEKELIFERGFGKNTGMGLFFAREILSITGITIAEKGKPGKGARFEMTVPNGAYRFPDSK